MLAPSAAFLAEASVTFRASPVGGGIGTIIVVGASAVGCCGTREWFDAAIADDTGLTCYRMPLDKYLFVAKVEETV